MSFNTYEESKNSGEPVELYYFRYGANVDAFFAYTDAEQEITVNGVVYEPTTIQRSNITASGSLDKSDLKIDLPLDTQLAQLFGAYPPGQAITLVIRQGHANDPALDFPVAWVGRIINCKRDGSVAQLTGEPYQTMLRRSGLRRHWQYGCPHVLYGSDCTASKVAGTITRAIIAVSGSRVTLADGWNAHAVIKYVGGTVEWESPRGPETRTILKIVDGKTLVLAGPASGLTSGDEIDVIVGCNHQPGITDTLGDCTHIHDRINDYGGQPWIPLKNPVNTNPFS